MGRLRQRRLAFIAAASLALHAVLLAWLALPARPTLLAIAPDPSLMSVELVAPAKPPAFHARSAAATGASRPAERPSQAIARQVPIAVSPPPGVATIPAAPLPATPAGPGPPPDRLRAALSAAGGCARATSREERERCAERLGRLDASTPSYDAPMDPGKRAYYDAVVAAGPSGKAYGDPKPGGAQPDGDYFRVLNCSIKFGAGKRSKGRQGEVRLGRTPCSIPLQGSFFTPEASVRRR